MKSFKLVFALILLGFTSCKKEDISIVKIDLKKSTVDSLSIAKDIQMEIKKSPFN